MHDRLAAYAAYGFIAGMSLGSEAEMDLDFVQELVDDYTTTVEFSYHMFHRNLPETVKLKAAHYILCYFKYLLGDPIKEQDDYRILL